jgi:hypothetical protein
LTTHVYGHDIISFSHFRVILISSQLGDIFARKNLTRKFYLIEKKQLLFELADIDTYNMMLSTFACNIHLEWVLNKHKEHKDGTMKRRPHDIPRTKSGEQFCFINKIEIGSDIAFRCIELCLVLEEYNH